jgi:uncharacterized protein (TIGR03435 family)
VATNLFGICWKQVKNTGLSLLLTSCLAFAQAPAFEVASIRPATVPRPLSPGDGGFFCPFGCFNGGRVKVDRARVDISFMALDQLILRAYGIKPHQLSGPDWMKNQRFDILANIPDGASAGAVPEMLKALLADRFKLATHRDVREQPVYALMVDKGGPKLQKSVEVDDADKPGDLPLSSPQGPVRLRRLDDGASTVGGPWGPIRMHFSTPEGKGPETELLKVTMPMLADAMTQFMDRPVVDATDLKGDYQVVLSMQDVDPFVRVKAAAFGFPIPPPPGDAPNAPAGNGPATASDPTGASTIFKTMEKLGLKLNRTRAPVEMLVVDRLEKVPTEN